MSDPQSLSEGDRGTPQHPFAQGMIPGALCETLKLGKGVLRFTHLQQSCRRFDAMLILLLQVSLHSFHATDWNLSQLKHLVNWGVDPSARATEPYSACLAISAKSSVRRDRPSE